MINKLDRYYQMFFIWVDNNLSKIGKIAAISVIAVLSLLWCLVRVYLFGPSEHIAWLGSAFSIAIMCLCALYFVRGSKYKDWSLEFTKYVMAHSAFFFLLGAAWPSLVLIADSFIELDSFSKSTLLSLAGLVYVIYKLKTFIFRINETQFAHTVHQFLSIPSEESYFVERIAATHEAGHALMVACLKNIPNLVSVSIKPDLTTAGRVSALMQMQSLTSTQLEWNMLLSLGGREAERYRFKEYSVGAAPDLSQWELYAHMYLRNGMGEYFYSFPSFESERLHNIQVIEQLKKAQVTQLQKFFTLNESVLACLESKLLQDKFIDDRTLKEILSAVIVTDDMPQPYNLF